MNHLFVDGNANVPGEIVAPVEAGANVMLFAVGHHQIVDLSGGDPRRHVLGADVANFRAHPARLAHPVDFGFGFDVDFHHIAAKNASAFLTGP